MPLQYGHLPNFSGFGPIDNAMRGADGGKNNTNRTHSTESLYPLFSKIFCVITPITTTNIIDIIKERISTACHLLKYLSNLNFNNITRTLRKQTKSTAKKIFSLKSGIQLKICQGKGLPLEGASVKQMV